MDERKAFYGLRHANCCLTRLSNGRKVRIPRPRIQPTRKRSIQVAGILEDRSPSAAPLLNRQVIGDMLVQPLGTSSSVSERAGFEHVRSIGNWVEDYGVELDM
jgi:hypothetical protein